MKANEDRSIILIENPLTGNDSFGKAMRLSGGEKWKLPALARAEVGAEVWRKAKKIILIREPLARYTSALTLLLNSGDDLLLAHGASPEFVEALKDTKATVMQPKHLFRSLTEMLSGLVASNGWDGIPVYLKPQSLWLTAKFDMVLATHNIAEFFNVETKVCCLRSNLLSSNRSLMFKATPTQEMEAEVRSLYSDDYSILRKVRVWSPSKNNIRLLSGYCSTCEGKRAKVDISEVVDLSKYQEGEPEPDIQAQPDTEVSYESEAVEPELTEQGIAVEEPPAADTVKQSRRSRRGNR